MSEQVKRFMALDPMFEPDEIMVGGYVLVTDYDALHAEAEAWKSTAWERLKRAQVLHAEAEALPAENERKQQIIQRQLDDHWKLVQAHAAQAKELESARGLLKCILPALTYEEADQVRAFLTATPAPEVQEENHD